MEKGQEIYYNVNSLVKKIQQCEEDRKALLLQIKTFQNTIYNSGSCGNLGIMCENLKSALENLTVTVQNDEENKVIKRKCRYFNRGYCKYGTSCRFQHSQEICYEYMKEGMCKTNGCFRRHPRHCKYWTGSPEGCTRADSCQYLHVESERFCSKKSHDEVDDHGVSWNNECYYDQNESLPGEECDISQDNREAPQDHRKSNDYDPETEEAYIVTRSDNGKIQFICKLCEATFASQKAIKQHGTMKHGDRAECIH